VSFVNAPIFVLFQDATKRDVSLVLSHYRGLSPKQDDFVFDSGDERMLIALTGTIPIVYRDER
jgi:hypothetical protein